jgi:FkbM family methyltransferase
LNMKIKPLIYQLTKSLGILKLTVKLNRKMGYLSTFTDHHANGVDLTYDIGCDGNLDSVRSIVDVGASIGSMTGYFLRIFPGSTVHAIEPYSVSYNALQATYSNNPNVKTHKIGLSDTEGSQKMFIQADSGYNSLNPAVNLPSDAMNALSEEIMVDTLDTFCSRNNISEIDLIKIDTEGLDVKVLKGGENLLRAGKIHYIYVECTFDRSNLQNTLIDDLRDYLSQFNYKVRAIYEQSNYGEKTYLTCVNALFKLQK